ncbi:MAG: ABC transporter substrate-binding protein [Pyrinomonadaceae bacterium]
MRARKSLFAILTLIIGLLLLSSCRGRSNAFVFALPDNIATLDPLGGSSTTVSSERLRQLMFNSLVRKNEKFEYVGELASDFKRSEDGLSITFILRDNVKFHDNTPFTSADAKYTIETLLASNTGKSASFFEGSGAAKQPFITGLDAPDARTLVVHLRHDSFFEFNQIISNLVAVGIIPQGSASTQKDKPVGTGAFKFTSYDSSQQVLELEGNENYWEGAPQIKNLRVRVIADAGALQAELKSGRVDCVSMDAASNLSPDAFKSLEQDPNLQVKQFPGANILYLGFNTQSAPLNNARVRQAVAYAIDREGIIRDLLLGRAQIAHSILPEESWAFAAGQKYSYNPEQAKKLLDEAGFRDPDSDGPQMRFPQPLVLKISSSSGSTRQYSGVIQNSLKQIGVPLEIVALETNTLTDQLLKGQYQMTIRSWVGGNQDPIFLRDLFLSTEIPTQDRAGRNRSRYNNPELDALLLKAVNTADRAESGKLYAQAQDTLSRDLPMMPLWYPAYLVIARKGVGNIQIRGDGNLEFMRRLTVENK